MTLQQGAAFQSTAVTPALSRGPAPTLAAQAGGPVPFERRRPAQTVRDGPRIGSGVTEGRSGVTEGASGVTVRGRPRRSGLLFAGCGGIEGQGWVPAFAGTTKWRQRATRQGQQARRRQAGTGCVHAVARLRGRPGESRRPCDLPPSPAAGKCVNPVSRPPGFASSGATRRPACSCAPGVAMVKG